MRAEWTNGPDEEKGAYGIYPMQIENVLLEECVAIGASDAGIYVGQSRNVIIRNNLAEYNAAGFEIENTVGADVYANTATNNTAIIIISSYYSTGYQGTREVAVHYDPYPETIYIYDNHFSGGGTSPDGIELKALKVALFGFDGSFPDVL